MTQLVDQYGQPLQRALLTKEIAGPSVSGVRSPVAGNPADGLNPVRLASILREAALGNPLRYFELAEVIEERDLHYAGVLATRKRSVAQIDISVEAASDAPDDVARADFVRDWLKRDELAGEVFDILDAIGKGISFTEIIWDASEGQFWPDRLEWRDPRWFDFDPKDLRTPRLLGGIGDDHAQAAPLPGFKFITAQIKAKSGLPVRGGLARLVAWSWMFKAFTQRDWAIFTQTYGQPVRIGKFGAGASEADKATLMRAVANIAGDCAAIIPESMMIEFIESKNVGTGSDLYERRSNWLDQQVSKAVLGQTATTDAIAGGHAVGQEHREVQQDIEVADCKELAANLNRDLIRPMIDLNFGPPKNRRSGYPRLAIARPEKEDLMMMVNAVTPLIDRGLRVSTSEMRDKFGLSDPGPQDEVLGARRQPAVNGAPDPEADTEAQTEAAPAPAPVEEDDDTSGTALQAAQELQAAEPVAAQPPHPAHQIADAMLAQSDTAIEPLLAKIELMMARAADLGELREMVLHGFPDLDTAQLTALITLGLTSADVAGRTDVEAESAG